MFVRNAFLNVTVMLHRCSSSLQGKWFKSCHNSRYFLPNPTPGSASPSQTTAGLRTIPALFCKGTAQHLEGLWKHPHTHDHSGSWTPPLDLEKSKTLSPKTPWSRGGGTRPRKHEIRLWHDRFQSEFTENVAVLKERLHLKIIFQKY